MPPHHLRAGRPESGAHRARPPGRHLRQHRVYPDQDDGRQRARRPPGQARRGLWRPRRPRLGRYAGRAPAQAGHRRGRAQRFRGPCRSGASVGATRAGSAAGRGPFHRPQDARGPPRGRRDAAAHRTPDLPRRRPPAGAPHDPRCRARLRARFHLDHGAGHRPRASAHHWERLHRAGVRPDVPPLWQPGHDRAAPPPPADARG